MFREQQLDKRVSYQKCYKDKCGGQRLRMIARHHTTSVTQTDHIPENLLGHFVLIHVSSFPPHTLRVHRPEFGCHHEHEQNRSRSDCDDMEARTTHEVHGDLLQEQKQS